MFPRSIRFATLALALTTPLVAAYAAPAFAAGESTSAALTAPASGEATTFTWSYEFGGGNHGLSNIAIGFCSDDILEDVVSATAGDVAGEIFLNGDVPGGHGGFGPGIKFNAPEDSGTITVTFDTAYPIADGGLAIQSHSGDGQDPDLTNNAEGPGPCSTDEVVEEEEEVVEEDEDDVILPVDISDPAPPSNSSNPAPAPSSNPAPVTDVLSTTVEQATDNGGPTLVLGATLEAGAELPRTGPGQVQTLFVLALSLIAAGTALRAAFTRRIRSACSPG